LSPANLELTVTEVPRLGPGEVLVRNTWLSVDRYVHGRMDNVPGPAQPPYQLGSALDGAAVGDVVDSRSEDVPVGTTLLHSLGWREYATVDASTALVVDTSLAPPQAYLGILGMPGFTAYVALTIAAPLRPGDVVFIANATSPVGNAAGQIARKLGASAVIGSAGGPDETLAALEVHGYDLVVDHHVGSVSRQLNRITPDGIDVYVGSTDSPLLEAAKRRFDRIGDLLELSLGEGVTGEAVADMAPELDERSRHIPAHRPAAFGAGLRAGAGRARPGWAASAFSSMVCAMPKRSRVV
jgi:NADPH-dependent curcumin reductase CurA